MTTEDPQYWEALTLLRRLEKMSDEALRPIAPQIVHLLRDLRRITGEMLSARPRGIT